MEKTALLIIDIQNIYFTEGELHLHNPEQAAENAKLLLDEWRKRKLPVIHIKHCFDMKEDAERNQYLNSIYPLLSPIEGEVVLEKHFPSAFIGTGLLDKLKELETDKLVVCGMMSNMCVDTTVRECQCHGIQVTLVQDACAAKMLTFQGEEFPGDLVHKVFMSAMDGMFAKVVDTKELLSM